MEAHIDKIMATYAARGGGEEEKLAHVADLKAYKGNDFNLDIPRYVDIFEEEEIDIDAVQVEKELVEVRKQMEEKLQQIQR